MIIAACIPVLQPLGELLFSKRMLSSGAGRTYENYGSGPSGKIRSENIELSNSVEARKRTQRQAYDISLDGSDTPITTVIAKGSQESILGQHNHDGKILRTDIFSVSVEQNNK